MKKAFTILLLLVAVTVGANNLQIKNVVFVDNDTIAKTVMIRFDISWDHSWRDEINWDAAWVFAKYFDGEKPYHHCKLSLEGATPGTGTAHELIVPNDSLELEGTYYGVGAFIYRSELSDGTFDADSVMLLWNYGLNGFTTLPEDIELHVYGTEMVYIPEGPFAFGDGDGENMSQKSWHIKGSPDYVYIGDYLAPLMVNLEGDDQARFIGIRVHGKEGLDWDGDGTIDNPRFPTGFNAFYIMKYETTQGQYTDFLNSLSENQIDYSNLFPNKLETRFAIKHEDGKYVCSRPDRACNYLKGTLPVSLADWMGLRPMSEMEYEKAARGPLNPIIEDFAWGSNNGEILTDLLGVENGTELPSPENSNFHRLNTNINGGDGGEGPVRSGIFALANTDRRDAGASYYGVMDLTGNIAEIAINLLDFADPRGGYRSFVDLNGDGELDIYTGHQNSIKRLLLDGSIYNLGRIDRSTRYLSVSHYDETYESYRGTRNVRSASNLP